MELLPLVQWFLEDAQGQNIEDLERLVSHLRWWVQRLTNIIICFGFFFFLFSCAVYSRKSIFFIDGKPLVLKHTVPGFLSASYNGEEIKRRFQFFSGSLHFTLNDSNYHYSVRSGILSLKVSLSMDGKQVYNE